MAPEEDVRLRRYGRMKRIVYFMIGVLAVMVFLPLWSSAAETKAKQPLPKVPITYAGDTDQAVIRRAQWVEEAKKEGTFSWWGNITSEQNNQIIAEFNKIYPFITVTYWRGSDKERNAKIESEHAVGRLSVDMIEPGDFTTNFPRWRKAGLVEKYTDFIPDIKRIDKRSYSRYGDWAQIGNNVIVPLYNTNKVSAADAPKSWEDLLNPKWKGKIGLSPDVKVWYTLALDESGWGLEKTENYLKKLKQQELIWASGHQAGFNLLIAGEFAVSGENFLRYVFNVQKKGIPADWVKVRPVVVTGSTFLLAKKAPHPNAARLFMEWLFSPNAAPLFEKVTGYGAAYAGSGTMTAKTIEGLPLVYRTEDVITKAVELGLVEKYSQILGITPE
jgi:iron(III) transport system substrate-binding protein